MLGWLRRNEHLVRSIAGERLIKVGDPE